MLADLRMFPYVDRLADENIGHAHCLRAGPPDRGKDIFAAACMKCNLLALEDAGLTL